MLDEENVEVLSENEKLKSLNSQLTEKISGYRKKLAGKGMFSFSSNRKRAEILYSLLLGNEALERVLTALTKKDPDEKSDYLMHQIKDVQKRRRLLAKIFDDDEGIKHHVRDILFKDERIDSAEDLGVTVEIAELPSKDEKIVEVLEKN